MEKAGLVTISRLTESILHQPLAMQRVLLDLSLNVSAIFRDPSSSISLRDAEDKDPLLGPGGVHEPAGLSLTRRATSIALFTDEPVAHSRPSIDVLFESAAYSHGERVIGVLLTGANRDGTHGLQAIKAHGGYVIVEDPGTAESAFMPRHATKHALADRVLHLARISSELVLGTADARAT